MRSPLGSPGQDVLSSTVAARAAGSPGGGRPARAGKGILRLGGPATEGLMGATAGLPNLRLQLAAPAFQGNVMFVRRGAARRS